MHTGILYNNNYRHNLLSLFYSVLVVNYALPSIDDLADGDAVGKFIKALNLWEVISVQELLQCLFHPE